MSQYECGMYQPSHSQRVELKVPVHSTFVHYHVITIYILI